jgi:hypothetical protein
MTYIINREIYNNALVHIGQSVETANTEDYEERAPYLLAAFCSTVKSLDKKVRKIDGGSSQSSFSPVCLALDQYFPLCDRFVPAAALYVACMLVIDEDADLADSLYDKYCDNVASIAAECEAASVSITPPTEDGEQLSICECESITERYFFD